MTTGQIRAQVEQQITETSGCTLEEACAMTEDFWPILAPYLPSETPPDVGALVEHLRDLADDAHSAWAGTIEGRDVIQNALSAAADALTPRREGADNDDKVFSRHEVRSLANWLRTPGNVNTNDALDECCRAIVNFATFSHIPGIDFK